MNKITFDYERKGYATEQVDKYINVLQENYKKMSESAESSEVKANDLEEKLEEQKAMLDKLKTETGRQLDDYKNGTNQLKNNLTVLTNENRTLQAQLNAGKEENRNLQEENRSLREESRNLQEENRSLREESRNLQEEDRNLQEENRSLREENRNLQTESKKLFEEKVSLSEEMKTLKEEISLLKEEKEELIKQKEDIREEKSNVPLAETDHAAPQGNHASWKKRDDIGKYLSEIYAKAEEQADEYIENVKREMEEERETLKEERDSFIAEAEKEAEKIKEAARQEKFLELEAEKNRLAQDYEERLAEIKFMKQEAEIEKSNAKEEAESILRQAQLKLELSEEKNKLQIEKALGKSRRIETEMEAQYQQLQGCLVDSANRMSELFEYLANINEAKDIEEIRRYANQPGQE